MVVWIVVGVFAVTLFAYGMFVMSDKWRRPKK